MKFQLYIGYHCLAHFMQTPCPDMLHHTTANSAYYLVLGYEHFSFNSDLTLLTVPSPKP